MKARDTQWPYPRAKEQIIQVVLITSAILLTAILILVVELRHRQKLPLSQKNIEAAASSLESYASEAKLVTYQAIHDRSPGSYRRIYLNELADQVKQIDSYFNAHDAADPLVEPKDSIARSNRIMHELLQDTATETDKGKLQNSYERFERLQKRYQKIGDSL